MDAHVLEFWGQVFLAASKNQKILEDLMSCFPDQRSSESHQWDMNPWVRAWSSGLKPLQSFLKETYGLGFDREKGGFQPQDMQEFSQIVLQNWKEMVSLLDVVPRQDYDSLHQENQELKKEVQTQKERIEYLQDLLREKGVTEFSQFSESLQEVLKSQNEHFQKFMQTMHDAWQQEQDQGFEDT